jgi:dethiobiotin synthetase
LIANSHFIFITGTDTGVGKTLLTALLIGHLRRAGAHAIAVKPFCSGGRADAKLLQSMQNAEFSLDELNPFHFEEPVTPLVAARMHRRKIALGGTVEAINAVLRKLEKQASQVSGIPSIQHSILPVLLIEGAGGLLSPLGENFDLLTLMQELMKGAEGNTHKISVIVAAANRLGTINHTLLTVRKLQDGGVRNISVVLNDISPPAQATPDMDTNFCVLTELLNPVPMFHLPNLGATLDDVKTLQTVSKEQQTLLKKIIG